MSTRTVCLGRVHGHEQYRVLWLHDDRQLRVGAVVHDVEQSDLRHLRSGFLRQRYQHVHILHWDQQLRVGADLLERVESDLRHLPGWLLRQRDEPVSRLLDLPGRLLSDPGVQRSVRHDLRALHRRRQLWCTAILHELEQSGLRQLCDGLLRKRYEYLQRMHGVRRGAVCVDGMLGLDQRGMLELHRRR